MSKLSRQEKIKILSGGGSPIELFKAKGLYINTLAGFLMNEKKILETEGPVFVEKDNKIYDMDGKPVPLKELIEAMKMDHPVLFDSDFYRLFVDKKFQPLESQ